MNVRVNVLYWMYERVLNKRPTMMCLAEWKTKHTKKTKNRWTLCYQTWCVGTVSSRNGVSCRKRLGCYLQGQGHRFRSWKTCPCIPYLLNCRACCSKLEALMNYYQTDLRSWCSLLLSDWLAKNPVSSKKIKVTEDQILQKTPCCSLRFSPSKLLAAMNIPVILNKWPFYIIFLVVYIS